MRICSGAGCLRKVPDNTRFCDECAKDKAQNTKPTGAERAQDDAILREYTTPRCNKGLRPRALQRYPVCVDCKRALSQVADHEIPARLVVAECRKLGLFPMQRFPGFYIMENLRGRCHSCHNAKSKVEDGQDWTEELDRLLAPYKQR